jgi:hypothetical protein
MPAGLGFWEVPPAVSGFIVPLCLETSQSAPGRNRTCDSRFRKSMQPSSPTCEYARTSVLTCAFASHDLPSSCDVSQSFAGQARDGCGTGGRACGHLVAASKVGGNPIKPCVSELVVNGPNCVRGAKAADGDGGRLVLGRRDRVDHLRSRPNDRDSSVMAASRAPAPAAARRGRVGPSVTEVTLAKCPTRQARRRQATRDDPGLTPRSAAGSPLLHRGVSRRVETR